MFLLDFGNQIEEYGNFGETFLASCLGHAGIHVGPLVVFAIGGILQVGFGVGHLAVVQELEPNLGMFLLITGSFFEKVGDLVVAFLAGLGGVVSLLVAGLGFASECSHQVGFGF